MENLNRIKIKGNWLFILLVVGVLAITLVLMTSVSDQQTRLYKEPKYVYIDLGANNGDSLMSFFELEYNGNLVYTSERRSNTFTDY